MSDFDKCFDILLTHEGGYSDNKFDIGGPTNMGITLESLSDFLERPATKDDIVMLTKDVAKQIYNKNYWRQYNLSSLASNNAALVIFDLGVLRGMTTVIKEAQTVLGLTVDGILGPKTVDSINSANDTQFCIKFLEKNEMSFIRMCQENQKQLAFLAGWLQRCFNLLDYILLPKA